MSNFKAYCEELEKKIEGSYTDGVTINEAEKLAGEFLSAKMKVSRELSIADLDRRMRKTGLKSIRAGTRLNIVSSSEKKPTESTIDAMVDCDKAIEETQNNFDTAEVYKEELERLFGIFKEAHIYFRGIGKGKFE